jgi:hypothetical protein
MGSISSFIGRIYSSEYINQYIKEKKIISCCVEISTQKIENLIGDKYYTYTSLWLSDKDFGDEDNPYGLVFEYGNYNKEDEIKVIVDDKGKEKKMEVSKSCVIYHYGKKGGLRYYAKLYKDYIDIFGNVAFVELNVENQIKFIDFINKLASINEEEWIKDKYHFLDNNCHSFVSKAIIILKPFYQPKDIKIKDKSKLHGAKRESVLPLGILSALKSYH